MGAYLRLLPLVVLGSMLSWSNASSGALPEVETIVPTEVSSVELAPIVDPGTPRHTPQVAYVSLRRF